MKNEKSSAIIQEVHVLQQNKSIKYFFFFNSNWNLFETRLIDKKKAEVLFNSYLQYLVRSIDSKKDSSSFLISLDRC